jgi:hypothetical protein
MSTGPVTAQSTQSDKPVAPPKWRAPLLLGILCAVGLTWAWLGARAKGPGRAASACYQQMFSGQTAKALEAFKWFKDTAELDVPEGASDEVFELQGLADYPIYTDKLDAYLMERIFFYCHVSQKALAKATDRRKAVSGALEYVRRHMQPGTRPETKNMVVTSMHILYRGYGNSIEMSWVMTEILRFRGIQTCIIILPPEEGASESYGLVGAVIDKRLHLFDPYRTVPLCRASDGKIADLQTLLAGADTLAPEFGGPKMVARLKKASYVVPSSVGFILPDIYRLADIIGRHRRPETIYRSFRGDMRNIAAGVFGDHSRVRGKTYTRLTVEGRDETVLLWDVPFKVDRMIRQPAYRQKLDAAHAKVRVYWLARQAHLFGESGIAAEFFRQRLQEFPDDADLAEDAAFFSAMAGAKGSDPPKMLSDYLKSYPEGRWRQSATMRLAEFEMVNGKGDAALELIAELKPPYDLRASLMKKALAGKSGRVAWWYPEFPKPGVTSAPAGN